MNGVVDDQKARLAISSGVVLLAQAREDETLLRSWPCGFCGIFGLLSLMTVDSNFEIVLDFNG